MVRHAPATLWRVIIACAVTLLVAVAPMALLVVSQRPMPDAVGGSRYGEPALMAVLVVIACAVAAAMAVALITARRLRLMRG